MFEGLNQCVTKRAQFNCTCDLRLKVTSIKTTRSTAGKCPQIIPTSKHSHDFDGAFVGDTVGAVDGRFAVGETDGAFAVGDCDGLFVGPTVGEVIGDADGMWEGDAVGVLEGLVDGAGTVGAGDGDPVVAWT